MFKSRSSCKNECTNFFSKSIIGENLFEEVDEDCSLVKAITKWIPTHNYQSFKKLLGEIGFSKTAFVKNYMISDNKCTIDVILDDAEITVYLELIKETMNSAEISILKIKEAEIENGYVISEKDNLLELTQFIFQKNDVSIQYPVDKSKYTNLVIKKTSDECEIRIDYYGIGFKILSDSILNYLQQIKINSFESYAVYTLLRDYYDVESNLEAGCNISCKQNNVLQIYNFKQNNITKYVLADISDRKEEIKVESNGSWVWNNAKKGSRIDFVVLKNKAYLDIEQFKCEKSELMKELDLTEKKVLEQRKVLEDIQGKLNK